MSEEAMTGTCDGCGAEGVLLKVINAAPVHGVCLCLECCGEEEDD